MREPGDLLAPSASVDALVECSAEPSALAGVDGETDYVVARNLLGAYNCLELARRDGAQLVFLSTSRVYPFAALDALRVRRGASTRFELAAEQPLPGVARPGSPRTSRSTAPRTLYGATKLAAELLIAEYARRFGLRTVDQPLRRDRRAVADGEGRPGRVHLLGAEPLLRARR